MENSRNEQLRGFSVTVPFLVLRLHSVDLTHPAQAVSSPLVAVLVIKSMVMALQCVSIELGTICVASVTGGGGLDLL